MKKFFFAFFALFVLILPLYSALTVSPAMAKISNSSNVLNLSAINNSSDDLSVLLDLDLFKGVAIPSTSTVVVIPANSSFSFKVAFYDNIYKVGNICVVEFQGKQKQVGATVKVCVDVTVNTTGEVTPSKESLNGVKGSTFFNSQLNMANALLRTASNKVEFFKSNQLFAESEVGLLQLNDLKQIMNSIDDTLGAENYAVAEPLFKDFFEKIQKLNDSLPIVTVLGQKTIDYFGTIDGQRSMVSEFVPQIQAVLNSAGIKDKVKVNSIVNARDKVEITRNIVVIAVKKNGDTLPRFQTNVRLFLKNNTPYLLSNTILLEAVPDIVGLGISNISAYYGLNLINENPLVFELYVGDLEPGVLKEVNYKIYDKIDLENIALLKVPVVSKLGVRQLQLSESEVLVSEFKDLLEKKKFELAQREAELEVERQAKASYWPYIAGFLFVLLLVIVFITNRTMSKVHKDMREMARGEQKKP